MEQFKTKRGVGKPRKWQSREDLIADINKYLEETPFEEYSVTGLTLCLGTSKQLLIDYQKRKEFKDIIDEAKLIVEHSYELSLRKNGRSGDIFALKNFDWKDKVETDHTSKGEKMVFMPMELLNKHDSPTPSTESDSQ
jgi:hypothetical protein